MMSFILYSPRLQFYHLSSKNTKKKDIFEPSDCLFMWRQLRLSSYRSLDQDAKSRRTPFPPGRR